MKRKLLLSLLCLTGSLLAETMFDVKVSPTFKDSIIKVEKGSGVDIIKDGETFCFTANGKKGAAVYYRPSFAPSLGTDNLTFSVLFKVVKKSAFENLICKGAGSHINPGFRFGVKFEKELPKLYALFVPPSTRPESKKYVQLTMNKNLTLPQNEWIHAAMTVNRSGKITLYLNGEEAGSQDISAYEKENFFANTNDSTFATHLGGGVRIARIKVKNELSSRIQIQKEADKWLDSVEK